MLCEELYRKHIKVRLPPVKIAVILYEGYNCQTGLKQRLFRYVSRNEWITCLTTSES